ncbi:MAG TPA: hypothetical protein VJX66_12680 [Amycolatopsis sp.]|nr:hypothetical protein [Amycolatopsis sp.]
MTEQLDPYELFAEDEYHVDSGAPQEPTSTAERQRTCGACGSPMAPGTRTGLEAFTDGEIRYVAVHLGHSTFAGSRERTAETRLRRTA